MELDELEVYRIARELNEIAWDTYLRISKEFHFSIGQQFLESVSSVGANIAEGYGRFHYLDSVKFFYNARGSLWEAKHWMDLLRERGSMTGEVFEKMSEKHGILSLKLNNLIKTTKIRSPKLPTYQLPSITHLPNCWALDFYGRCNYNVTTMRSRRQNNESAHCKNR